MQAFQVLGALLVALTMAASGIGKLSDPSGTAAGFSSLKVPKFLSPPLVVRALPWVEMAIAVGVLLPGPLGWIALLGALALFVAYWVLVARALRSGEAADCNCFGAAASGKVTRLTLVRNTVLVLVGLLALVGPIWRPSPLAALAAQGPEAWAGVLMGVLGMALVGLVLTEPKPAAAPEQPSVEVAPPEGVEGDYVRLPIPFASLRNSNDDLVTLRAMAATRPVLLLFVSPTCGSCTGVLERIPGWIEQLPVLDIRPVTNSLDALRAAYPDLAGVALGDPNGDTAAIFGFLPNPSAVLLGADGLLAGGPVAGEGNVTQLVEDIAAELAAVEQGSEDVVSEAEAVVGA